MKTIFFITLMCITCINATGQKLNVLFIGNSYTHGHNMPKIFEALANSKGKDVFADSIAVSGSSLKGHCDREHTWKKIKSKKWDIVFIQGFSRELAQPFDTITLKTLPFAQQIVDSVKKSNKCVQLFLYMTWGYKLGYEHESYNLTYDLMQENIQKGYDLLSEKLNIPVAPVGLVWKDFKTSHPKDELYQEDNQHPTPNGSFLAACTFYSAIFRETSVGGLFPKAVNQVTATAIQNTVDKIVLNNLAKYKLNIDQHPKKLPEPTIDFDLTVNWTSITCDNKTLNGGSYVWEFGDGKTSKKNEPVYYYSKSGTYTVTLTVFKGCHQYKMKKKVMVSTKVKNAMKPKKKK